MTEILLTGTLSLIQLNKKNLMCILVVCALIRLYMYTVGY